MSKSFKIFFTLFFAVFLSGCTNLKATTSTANQTVKQSTNYITVTYRQDSVNVASPVFEYVPTSSSLVNGLWYDQSNKYMIIKLNSTYYHYCGLPTSEWTSFKKTDSYGTYYKANIKGNYDCRKGYVPNY